MPKLTFQYVVGVQGPETILEFLCRRFRYHDQAEWIDRIMEGRVTVNGRKILPHHPLESHQKITYDRQEQQEPEVDARYRILFQDDHLLAVEKSGNIPTSPSGKYWNNCLVHILKDDLGMDRLHAVHRLDRETSGVNLFAKTPEAAGKLGKIFGEGKVEKTYTAILKGAFPAKEIVVNAPLGKDPASTIHIRQTVLPEGRPCITHFQLLARLDGASLVRVLPVTGRTHQIRAHAYHLGFPVYGDKLYGITDDDFRHSVDNDHRSSDARHLLHATSLSVPHPVTDQTITFVSPPRDIFQLWVGQAFIKS